MFGAFSPDSRQLAVALESRAVHRAGAPPGPGDHAADGTTLAFPAASRSSGADVQFSADGRHLAATVFRRDGGRPSGPRTRRLRPDLGPPLPGQPTCAGAGGTGLPGDGAQPGRPDPLHELAADGVRRGVGHADLAPPRRAHVWPSTSTPREPSSHSRMTRDGEGTVLVDAADGRTVTRCGATATRSSTSGSPPTARWWGRSPDDGELIVWDSATGRSLERWDTFDPYGVGFSPDNDLVHGWRRRLDAPHLGPVRAGDLPPADDPGRRRRRVRARRPLTGRTAGGLQLARRPGQGMGQVRRHRHRSATPPSQLPVDTGRMASAGRAARGIPRGGSTWRSAASSARRARGHGVGRPCHGTTRPAHAHRCATVFDRWRTSTRVAACSRATTDGTARRPSSTPRPFVPRGEPFDVAANCCTTSYRGRQHGDGLRGLVRRSAAACTGG